jgi:hypothetical protein
MSMAPQKPALGIKPSMPAKGPPTFLEEGHNTGKMGKHPGFAALVKSGVPAGALANTSRNASPAAKKANPRLKRVK